MKEKTPRCFYCNRPAVVFCDYITGFSREAKATLCSRAICDEHRRRIGHVCKRGRGGGGDTIDYCAEHEVLRPRDPL